MAQPAQDRSWKRRASRLPAPLPTVRRVDPPVPSPSAFDEIGTPSGDGLEGSQARTEVPTTLGEVCLSTGGPGLARRRAHRRGRLTAGATLKTELVIETDLPNAEVYVTQAGKRRRDDQHTPGQSDRGAFKTRAQPRPRTASRRRRPPDLEGDAHAQARRSHRRLGQAGVWTAADQSTAVYLKACWSECNGSSRWMRINDNRPDLIRRLA